MVMQHDELEAEFDMMVDQVLLHIAIPVDKDWLESDPQPLVHSHIHGHRHLHFPFRPALP